MRGGLDDALNKLARRDELRRRSEGDQAPETPPAVTELVEAIAAVVGRHPGLGLTVGVEGVSDPLLLHFFFADGQVQVNAETPVTAAPGSPGAPRHADFDVDVDQVYSAPPAYSTPADHADYGPQADYGNEAGYGNQADYATQADYAAQPDHAAPPVHSAPPVYSAPPGDVTQPLHSGPSGYSSSPVSAAPTGRSMPPSFAPRPPEGVFAPQPPATPGYNDSYYGESDTAERQYGSFDQPPATHQTEPAGSDSPGESSRDLGARMRDLGMASTQPPNAPHPFAPTPPPPVPPQTPSQHPLRPAAPSDSGQPTRRIQPEQYRAPAEPSAAERIPHQPTSRRSMTPPTMPGGLPAPLPEPIPLQVERPEETEIAARRLAALLRDDPSLLGQSE